MIKFRARVRASKAGSIGTKYCELRIYEIEAADVDDFIELAIKKAHGEGLEHVLVTNIAKVTP